MSAEGCRAALLAAPVNRRAPCLDEKYPHCACEPWSLTEAGGEGIPAPELLARVLTSPDAFDEDSEAILTQKLTQLYAMGMSVIRQGASDDEILGTVTALVEGAAEPKKLVGAIVMPVQFVRSYANDDGMRWFGVYATDHGDKQHHGDIFGTTVSGGQQRRRRYKFAEEMLPMLIPASTGEELLAALRATGI